VMATQAEMHEDIARTLNWKRRCRPVASTFIGGARNTGSKNRSKTLWGKAFGVCDELESDSQSQIRI
jgi:hypothetical protein